MADKTVHSLPAWGLPLLGTNFSKYSWHNCPIRLPNSVILKRPSSSSRRISGQLSPRSSTWTSPGGSVKSQGLCCSWCVPGWCSWAERRSLAARPRLGALERSSFPDSWRRQGRRDRWGGGSNPGWRWCRASCRPGRGCRSSGKTRRPLFEESEDEFQSGKKFVMSQKNVNSSETFPKKHATSGFNRYLQ